MAAMAMTTFAHLASVTVSNTPVVHGAGLMGTAAAPNDTATVVSTSTPTPLPTVTPAGGLPPIPRGFPTYFSMGLFNANTSDLLPGIPFDFRYQYLAGGVNTGDGWANWNSPPGQYALNYINDSRAHSLIPAFQYYQILQSAPHYDEYLNMQEPSTMYAYFDDWKLLMTKCAQAGGGVVVVSVEADLTGVMQQRSQNDDATTVPARVNASGHPDAAGYPDNFAGMYAAMAHIRDVYAPNVVLALDVSAWGAGDDVVIALRDDPNYDWRGHADRTAHFLNTILGAIRGGAGFELLSWNPSDRDAAYYQVVEGSNRWWDDGDVRQPTFATMGAWIGRIGAQTGRRVVLWQVPNGNRVYRTENNSDGHYQDNRPEYFLNPGSGRAHMSQWANWGVVGIWWGAGAGSQSHYYDHHRDGVTNPPPINGNVEVSVYPDDDGGYLRLRSSAYYSQGPLPLPSGGSSSPTPVSTSVPSSTPAATSAPTYTATRTATTRPTSTSTPTRTATPAPTFTPTTATTATATGTPTSQPARTQMSTPPPTGTPTAAPTDTPTGQPTLRPTNTPIAPTATSTATAIASASPSGSTRTPTPSATRTPTGVPTAMATATATATATRPPSPTYTFTVVATATRTQTQTQTRTPAPSATPTACSIYFRDVPADHPFYPYIRCLKCRRILGGYSDGTFRPDNYITRGQLSKIVANAASIQDPVPPDRQSFSDVPPTHPFWVYIERLSARGIIGGYADGTFRPDNNATRGQTAKIETNAFFPDCRRP
jgi:hypothetical protein